MTAWMLKAEKEDDIVTEWILELPKLAKILGMDVGTLRQLLASCGGSLGWREAVFYEYEHIERFIQVVGEERLLAAKLAGYNVSTVEVLY